MSLTRDQILKAPRPDPARVEVPQWGGEVLIGVMDGLRREQFERIYFDPSKGQARIRATLIAYTVVDEEGCHAFAEADIPEINRLDSPTLIRLYDVALRINALSKDDIDEIAKNSKAAPSASSP